LARALIFLTALAVGRANAASSINSNNRYSHGAGGGQRAVGRCRRLGKVTVDRIDARCLDCAEPLTVRMRDGQLMETSPETVVGHSNTPLARAAENWPYT